VFLSALCYFMSLCTCTYAAWVSSVYKEVEAGLRPRCLSGPGEWSQEGAQCCVMCPRTTRLTFSREARQPREETPTKSVQAGRGVGKERSEGGRSEGTKERLSAGPGRLCCHSSPGWLLSWEGAGPRGIELVSSCASCLLGRGDHEAQKRDPPP
jgi:hypothetical protein